MAPVRGFSRANAGRRGVQAPALPRGGLPSKKVPGAPVIPRVRVNEAATSPALPAGWGNSQLEWIVWAYLVLRKRFREGRDFAYQAALPAPGLNSKDFNRADFWILPTGANGVPDGFYPRGVVLNPISPFTHQLAAKDKIERLILGNAGFREVFLDDRDLQTRPGPVIEAGLRGRDRSSRGEG